MRKTFLALFLLAGVANAYTVVTVAPGTSESVETDLLAAATSQFLADVKPNPFVTNTWTVTLRGPNPNFNPPLTNRDLLDQIDRDEQYIATADSVTYFNGYINGLTDQQNIDIGTASRFSIECTTSTTAFFSVGVDTTTCLNVIRTIMGAIEEFQTGIPQEDQ